MSNQMFTDYTNYTKTIPIPSEDIVDVQSISVNIDCVACRANLINTIIVPCQHALFCTSCARTYVKRKTKMKKPLFCPACYTIISEINILRLHYMVYEQPPAERKVKSNDTTLAKILI